jgi:iron complex transport system ATP-binding protein
MDRADAILEIEGLQCAIGGSPILASVSCSVPRGGFVSVIGPNGAGKTTLLRCLVRIVPFQGGSIRLDGSPLAAYRQKELARLVGYVPQGDARHLPFTVEEFVLTGRYPYLSPFTRIGREDREASQTAMEVTGTARFADRRVSTLSGGERQLVMIAAALAQGPGILLLDEPTAFLDPRHQASVMSLLVDLNRRHGMTVMMVTHDVNQAILAGQHVAVIDGGRTVHEGPAGMLAGSGVLERVYRRRFLYMPHPRLGCDIIVPDVGDDGSET